MSSTSSSAVITPAHDPVIAAASLPVHHRVFGWFGGKIDEVWQKGLVHQRKTNAL
jgi:hypothetical protein